MNVEIFKTEIKSLTNEDKGEMFYTIRFFTGMELGNLSIESMRRIRDKIDEVIKKEEGGTL